MKIGGFIIQDQDIIMLVAIVATFAAIMFVWFALLEPKPVSDRMKDLKQRREALREGLLAATKSNRNEVKQSSLSLMRKLVERLDLMKGDVAKETADKLARAGLRTKDAMVAFLFFKIALPFIGGAFGLIVINMLANEEMPFFQRVLLAFVVAAVSFFMPDIMIKNLAAKRQKLIQKGLPDALDLLVVCAQAGLSLDAAISRVAREIVFSSPVVGEELSLTALELGFLPDRRQALENLKDRTGVKEISSVVSTLVQSEKYGTPLAYALRVLANEFRRDRLMRAEEKAARLPAIMTLPLAFFILPVLFMVVIGPAIIQVIASFATTGLPGSGSPGQ